ncbi:MAG: DUF3566 domain-containing protein [Actinomycetota bacterium]|nr:DUF3566 domain-containing protein [Actinomycetota bacterium]
MHGGVGVVLIAAGVLATVEVTFGLRSRLPSSTVAALLAGCGAVVGLGGLSVQHDVATASWIVTPLLLAIVFPLHVRVLFAGSGPLRTDGYGGSVFDGVRLWLHSVRTVATIEDTTTEQRQIPEKTPPFSPSTAAPAVQPLIATPRRSARDGRGQRTRVEIRRIGPWSALKFSLLFYFCVMLIVWIALLIIYLLLSAAGAVDSLAKLLGYLVANGPNSTKGPTPVRIDGAQIFTYLFVAGCVLTVAWALVNLFVALIYNLISDVIGGLEITLADKNR